MAPLDLEVLVHHVDLAPRQRRRVQLGELVEVRHHAALLVAQGDLTPQRLLRHHRAQGLLQPPGQALDLRPPLPHGLLGDGLGQLHDVCGPETVHDLVHLLLAVAGRLPHHQIAEVK